MLAFKIKNYENYYVTDTGDVYSRNGTGRFVKLKKLAGRPNYRPYYYVRLYDKNHIGSNCAIHRIVAQAFIPNPENKPCVNHKDGNKHNNNVSNLEWCTYSENSVHSIKVLKNKNGGKPKKSVTQIKDGKKIATFDSVAEAARQCNLKRTNIKEVVCGRNKTAGGYQWTYNLEVLK